MAQLVKNPPAMRETWFQSLGWEDPLEKGMATHPVFLLGKFHLPEPVLYKRNHCNEKPVQRMEEWPPLAATRESPCSNEDPVQPKINKITKKKTNHLAIPGLSKQVFWESTGASRGHFPGFRLARDDSTNFPDVRGRCSP